MKVNVLVCLLGLLEPLCWAGTVATSRPTLQFEIAMKPDSDMGKELIKAMTHVLDRLGYNAQFRQYPAKRGLLEFKAGRIDGTLARVGNLSEILDSTNIRQIEQSVAVFNYSRWCRKGVSQSQPKIRVASRLGSVAMSLMEPYLRVPRFDLQEMKDQSAGVKMLKSSRLDCILTTEITLEAEGVTPKDLQEFNRADLVTFQLFPWILDKHEPIREAIAAGLKTYSFSTAYQHKFLDSQRVCNDRFNTLCPDGILFHEPVNFNVNQNSATLK